MLIDPSRPYQPRQALTLTFGPGVVRRLHPATLLKCGLESVVREIESYPAEPVISLPQEGGVPFTPRDIDSEESVFALSDSSEHFLFENCFSPYSGQPYREFLAEIALVLARYVAEPFSSFAYLSFRSLVVPADGEQVVDEFLDAWMRDAFENEAVTRSFLANDDYLIDVRSLGVVFRRTPFLRSRMAEIEARHSRTDDLLNQVKRRLSPEKASDKVLTLTFGPGVVRYLDPQDLLDGGFQKLVAELEPYEGSPVIRLPEEPVAPGLDLNHFGLDPEGRSYEHVLRDLAKVMEFYPAIAIPSICYFVFSQGLEVTDLEFDEFAESFVREAFGDDDVQSSYQGVDGFVDLGMEHFAEHMIFRVTPFVASCRQAIAAARAATAEEEAQKGCAEMEQHHARQLYRSSFETFTYLMEDHRNRRIKIGQSKTPWQRERTLQSEAPSVELRFAIPTEADAESRLHSEYAHLRVRGEWFELEARDLVRIMEKLIAEGDSPRLFVSKEWLAEVFIIAKAGSEYGAGDAVE